MIQSKVRLNVFWNAEFFTTALRSILLITISTNCDGRRVKIAKDQNKCIQMKKLDNLT